MPVARVIVVYFFVFAVKMHIAISYVNIAVFFHLVFGNPINECVVGVGLFGAAYLAMKCFEPLSGYESVITLLL
jgi:hypothetical protein